MRKAISVLLALVLATTRVLAGEPPLPPGIDSEPSLPGGLSDEPTLPPGLPSADKASTEAEPGLPSGLGGDSEQPAPPDITTTPEFGTGKATSLADQFDVSGFVEGRVGVRTNDDPLQKRASIAETRFQLDLLHYSGSSSFKLTADLIGDAIDTKRDIDIDEGRGWFDLREAWWQRPIGKRVDLKLGRQVLTWGVGDLLFLNDLFPKDWNSFFIGRDVEYLKAPSDAIKLAFFFDAFNVDLVVIPEFDPDRFIDGRRISYYNPGTGSGSGREAVIMAKTPDKAEFALRAYRQSGAFETALYAYDGYWKSPAGISPVDGEAIHPALRVLGASLRGPVGPGIVSAEVADYQSRDDRQGSDPWINNSEFRLLIGYESELAPDFTGGLQFYLESLRNYDNYRENLAGFWPRRKRFRQLYSLRLTRLAMNQNLNLSLFTFMSPTDKDFYLRPKVHYKMNDHLSIEAGANVFGGDKRYTFFAQFDDASNVYLGIKYSF